MLHAAAMFIGLALVAALLAPGQLWIILASAGGGLAASIWLGGVTPAPLRLPAMAPLLLRRLGANLGGAIATARAALAGDVALKPALVRLRTRLRDPSALAALAGMISAAPGANVVETDADGLLVHVLNEDVMEADALAALEARMQFSEGLAR